MSQNVIEREAGMLTAEVEQPLQLEVSPKRARALDRCLFPLEEALVSGQRRVDAGLGSTLRAGLGEVGLIPNHRLEGRKVERVIEDIFKLQAQLLGQVEDN